MYVKFLLISIVTLSISCTYLPSLPYKIDIQQGNVVTEEMVEKLRPGMTRSQIRFLLGSPLITDVFHSNRWDYVYNLAPSGRLSEKRRLTIFFDGDILTHIEGDFTLPTMPVNGLLAPLPESTEKASPLESKDENLNEEQTKVQKNDKSESPGTLNP